MPDRTPGTLVNEIFDYAIQSIREVLDSTHADATPSEKLIRIGWIIGNLPPDLREAISSEAQNRVWIGIVTGMKPTRW